ncbi:MAG: hypothetical protein WB558_23395, partial [Terriglobales bacterium]
DRDKSRFSGHAVVAHIRSLPTTVHFAITLLARYTISSRLPVPDFVQRKIRVVLYVLRWVWQPLRGCK